MQYYILRKYPIPVISPLFNSAKIHAKGAIGLQPEGFWRFDSPALRQKRYSGFASSFHVFRSWHGLQRLCQLFLSQKRTWFPRCGLIWSTTVASTIFPSFMQHTQYGCCRRYESLAFCHFLSYPRLPAPGLSPRCCTSCCSQ